MAGAIKISALRACVRSLILDSFAGSGTTAHAVLALSAKDGGKRRFILCETEAYADTLAAESKGTGKQALVFAAAKLINHRSLRELKVDFAQLPYALHRVQSEWWTGWTECHGT